MDSCREHRNTYDCHRKLEEGETMKPFWLVWNPAGSNPRHCHNTYEEAKNEAVKLAKKAPQNVFYVVESRTSICANDVQITDLRPSTVSPF